MPKKKIDTEALENISEVETTLETIIEAPTLSESEQIVEGNKELAQIKADIAESRANFVKQTDKQLSQIKELEDKISTLTSDYEDKKNIIEEIYPVERAKFIAIQNETTIKTGEADARIAEANTKEANLVKKEDKILKQKEANDVKSAELETQSISLSQREKALNDAAKEIIAFKNAMAKI